MNQAHRHYLSVFLALAVSIAWLGNVAYVACAQVTAEAPVLDVRTFDDAFDTVFGCLTSTRDGVNDLRNIAAALGATGAQYSYTLQTDAGDVILNTLEGNTPLVTPDFHANADNYYQEP